MSERNKKGTRNTASTPLAQDSDIAKLFVHEVLPRRAHLRHCFSITDSAMAKEWDVFVSHASEDKKSSSVH
jgi:hypothetical protein